MIDLFHTTDGVQVVEYGFPGPAGPPGSALNLYGEELPDPAPYSDGTTFTVDADGAKTLFVRQAGAWVQVGEPTGSVALEAAEREAADALLIPLTQRGAASGVATLDSGGKVPDAQIPSGVARDAEVASSVAAAVAALVNSAPGTLDTLAEIATALGNDPNLAATLTALIGAKAADTAVVHNTGNETVAGVKTFTSTPVVPDGSFSVAKLSFDPATQAELDGEASARATADGLLVPLAQKGAANGVATLGSDSKIPDAQIPDGVTRDSELAVAIAALVNAAPSTLDTLNELAAALGDDPSFATTIAAALAAKAADSAVVHNTGDETVAGVKTFSSSPVVPTPTTALQAATKGYVDTTAAPVIGTAAAVTVNDTTTPTQTANTAALAAACAAAVTAKHNTVILPAGDISFNATLALTAPIRFVGSSLGPKPDGFTQTNLCYTGTGEAILLGSDNGQAPDTAPAYDGVESVELDHVSLAYTGTATSALDNGTGTYGTGTYGVRDWRGGRLKLNEASITGFEFGFWGELSDENTHVGGKIKRCHTGAYIGTRSDQYNMLGVEFYKCDRAIDIEGASQVRVFGVNVVDCGAGSTCAIKIDSIDTRASVGVIFDACWFESLGGATSDAFIEVGTTGATKTVDVLVQNPYVNTHNLASGLARAKSLFKLGNAARVRLTGQASGFETFDQIAEFVGSTSPDIDIETHGTHQYTTLNSGSGTPIVRRLIRNLSGGHTFGGDITWGRASDGTRRYKSYLTGTEAGGNAGSDLQIDSYSDAGAFLATVLKIARATSAVTFPGLVTLGSLNTADATNEGIPQTFDPAIPPSSAALAADGAVYHRARKGSGAITAIGFKVVTSSGNVDVGIYRTNGSGGAAARPSGAPANHSGSVACPAIGDATVAITSTSVTAGSDWFGFATDNATATFSRLVAVSSTAVAGLSYSQSSGFPLATVGSLVGNGSVMWMKGA